MSPAPGEVAKGSSSASGTAGADPFGGRWSEESGPQWRASIRGVWPRSPNLPEVFLVPKRDRWSGHSISVSSAKTYRLIGHSRDAERLTAP